MSKPVYLVVSLDVEEEGLFTGSYPQYGVTVTNTSALRRLAPLLALGIKPTLFCAYPVLTDARSCHIIKELRDEAGAEIAAHLHHWNTPPITTGTIDPLSRVPSRDLPDDVFQAKLENVLANASKLNGAPVTSFRMGRWDLHKKHFPLLARAGILTDASVRPLHGTCEKSRTPDHFAATATPYWVPTQYGHIFEVPLTVTPLVSAIRPLLDTFRHGNGCLGTFARYLASTTNYWGALALLPVYHPLWAMKAITRYYLASGGNVLSLTWHSSEMQEGATPHLPTEAHVRTFLKKITVYMRWLMRHYEVHCLTMSELRNSLGHCARSLTATQGDWTVAP